MNNKEYLEKYYKGNIIDAYKRLESGEPVQYIVGNVDFYGNKININKNVLIPRFETETLVEKAINYIKKYFDKDVDVLDIGTGSGCIAIALKHELNCNIDACDISDLALDVARINAKENNCKINFYKSNFLDNIEKKYDVIISNPPYISYNEEIEDIVKNNEPHLALYSDNNGLKSYEEIINNIEKNLKEKAIIAFEIGRTQGSYIKELIEKNLKDTKVFIEKDLSQNDRYVFAFYNINE